ncbi:ABC transporter ATP-binding protein [Pseudobdellovibrio exovorus]|uniref:ABC-type transport, ATP-binding protein n=1 Tax=Pseudobdellovibrio exovorus JSS TaxID=1184267 RepID=M4VAT2_9BACT|nr:ABC transporter ATP-binding protein [Pseudobdellovibrio exovorus]AGH95131.1 ABC-type transport, ATP-binding protein [Pseudobdellovibrio exovorus JSS]
MVNDSSACMIEVKNVVKNYVTGSSELEVLKDVSFGINAGEAVCLLGASGAGKSTLLQIMGTLDRPTSGQVLYRGDDVFALNDEKLSLFRNQKMGFVFQFHHLIQEMTALENIMLPSLIAGDDTSSSRAEALKWLEFMGLGDRAEHFPHQLSGGELQRVAIARALIKKPEVLFADEPTGNLDSENSRKIQDLFFQLRDQLGLTLIVVTHDMAFAEKFPRVFKVKDGRLA